MEREISCGDIVPGCSFKTKAASEDDLLREVVRHAREEHGVTEVGPDLLAKVKASIKESA